MGVKARAGGLTAVLALDSMANALAAAESSAAYPIHLII